MNARALHFFRCSIFLSLLLLVLGYIVSMDGMEVLDTKIGEAFYQLGGIDRFFIFLSFLGSRKFFYPALGLFSLFLIYKKYFRSLIIVWANLIGVSLLNHFLKSMYTRERPSLDHLVDVNYYSFPSGHSMNSFAFYGMIAFLLISMVHVKKIKIAIILSTATFIILIGLSRIYLGVHFPLDVLAGFVAGSAWLSFIIGVWIKFAASSDAC
ncbi:phosphatase PAP2 family protein [Sutcliffiella halmapala]|uniref:phosphatase PAP2 family protein n=1 Tax=Sutcliffiella halmapala TaxID=79882 RepID=UPI001473E693|nr:phosphatase PAP2 family protein [Sutcliffiella halmapala]